MKIILTLIFFSIFSCTGCYNDTDINVKINVNVNASGEIPIDIETEICAVTDSINMEPEPPKDPDSGLYGKWAECSSNDECETSWCLCSLCVDPLDFY